MKKINVNPDSLKGIALQTDKYKNSLGLIIQRKNTRRQELDIFS